MLMKRKKKYELEHGHGKRDDIYIEQPEFYFREDILSI